MAPYGVVESVDVPADGLLSIVAGLEHGAPDEFRLQRLEENLDHRVIIAVPLADIEIRMPCFRSSAW